MRSIPIPMGSMSYQDRVLPWNAQRLVNCYPETAPQDANAKTPIVLIGRAGLDPFSETSGMIRGRILMQDVLYAVIGSTFYLISQGGSAISLGTVPGSGLVSMAVAGEQVTIVAEPRAWVYTITGNTFNQITDPDFPGSKAVTSLGGYFVHAVPGTNGEFFLSNLLDGENFDALDFATAEMDSDSLIVPFETHNELWLFGALTIEPWTNRGLLDFPLSPITSIKIERGCAAGFSVCKVDNTVFWIGDDRIVYRANGYTPQRVSQHGIEKILTDTMDLSNVRASTYIQDGHTFYMLQNPGVWTLRYDAATNWWHENTTYLQPYWQFDFVINAYDSVFAFGEDENIYTVNLETHTDDGGTIVAEVTSPPIHANTARMTMSRFQIDIQAGMGLNDGQGDDPQAMLQWSDDGGHTWSYEHWRPIGKIGKYKDRAIWRRLGQFYQRVFRLRVSDPIRIGALGGYADVEVTPA